MAAVEKGIIKDAILAQNEGQRARFWSYRDSIAELLADMAPNVNFDIGIPISKMKEFTADITTALKAEFGGIRLVTFGHIGDGNLHLSCTTGKPQDQVPIEELVFAKATAIGGTITAEHGIGVLKKPWLKDCRTAQEIALMKRLKAMLDPADILNKGRVI
jgi:FAD/FMN-containing dehydrogenase